MDYAEDPEPPNREADEWRRECETLRTALAARDRRIEQLEVALTRIRKCTELGYGTIERITSMIDAALATPPTKDEEGR